MALLICGTGTGATTTRVSLGCFEPLLHTYIGDSDTPTLWFKTRLICGFYTSHITFRVPHFASSSV